MTPLPLSSQTLAWLNHAADAGQRDAQVLLHLIARADAQDQWFAKFTDSYSRTIAALCRRLEALERGANDLTAAPDPVEPEIEVCETCDGEGTIDERLGGISTSNPAATCPDCDGVGEPRRFHRQPPAAPPSPEVAVPEDLAADQAMAANLSALLIRESGLHSPGSSTHDLLQRVAAMLVNYGMPARSATPPAPEPGEAAHPTYLDAIRLAQGCHDYSGGHSGTEGEAWHGAIDTVVAVLKRAAVRPWDSQTRAVYGVGAEAQAGEVEA
jgi:hypothetical protein